MVWVSNQSGTCLNVSISSAHTSGGNPGFFPVEHELENWAVNHWHRAAAPSETAVVHLRNTTATITDVKGNDLLVIFGNTWLKVPDVLVSYEFKLFGKGTSSKYAALLPTGDKRMAVLFTAH
ncbi:hypothetical protein PC9H_002997 [Pleurotus ostreatus]|uniref:Uncharacterized protein n=1 Tax=Pleurotus ostreatus TaxID=5322 RepID=A0A8H7A1P0_PLEOS|nr:uncharacterized protein PC9H_002997 [Pleurotus ostreatus]KAF7436171.1 hypothetical protein PC9H_002997 [Pleurotus ostreatus]